MQDTKWLSLLNVNGKAAFHDYGNNTFPGVKIAVDRFLCRNTNYKIKSTANNLVIIEKTAATKRAEVSWFDLVFAFAYNIILTNRQGFKRTIKKLLPFAKRDFRIQKRRSL